MRIFSLVREFVYSVFSKLFVVFVCSVVSEERNIFSSFVLRSEKDKLLTQMGQYIIILQFYISFRRHVNTFNVAPHVAYVTTY